MRAIGPQSVSSFLKVALDVVYAAACVAVAIIGPIALGLLVWLPFSNGDFHLTIHGKQLVAPFAPLPLVGMLLMVEAYTACLVVILNRIRRIVETLTVGDPFRPENVGRLRLVGVMMIGLEIAGNGLRALLAATVPRGPLTHAEGNWFNPTAWFAIMVVFVLAEVFREGARLRREAELTI